MCVWVYLHHADPIPVIVFHRTYFCSSYRCRSPNRTSRHIGQSGRGHLARDRIWDGAEGAGSRTDPPEMSRLRPIASCDLYFPGRQVWGWKTSLKCPLLLLSYLEQWTCHIARLVFLLCAIVGSFVFLNIWKHRICTKYLKAQDLH
jgi:hypothetical protein